METRGKSLDPLEPVTRAASARSSRSASSSRLGLGHAVWCARHIVGDEPFAVLLPDDLMAGTPGALKQMVDAYAELGGNILCTEEVPADRTASYGIITPGETKGRAVEVKGLVEKPETGRRAVDARRHRPLHPPAGDDGCARQPASRAPAARSS